MPLAAPILRTGGGCHAGPLQKIVGCERSFLYQRTARTGLFNITVLGAVLPNPAFLRTPRVPLLRQGHHKDIAAPPAGAVRITRFGTGRLCVHNGYAVLMTQHLCFAGLGQPAHTAGFAHDTRCNARGGCCILLIPKNMVSCGFHGCFLCITMKALAVNFPFFMAGKGGPCGVFVVLHWDFKRNIFSAFAARCLRNTGCSTCGFLNYGCSAKRMRQCWCVFCLKYCSAIITLVQDHATRFATCVSLNNHPIFNMPAWISSHPVLCDTNTGQCKDR